MAETQTHLEDLNLVDAARVQIRLSDTGHLDLELNGQHYEDASVKRCFPLLKPTQYLALLDAKGKELGLLENLMTLDKDSQEALARYFEVAYFVANILRIRKVEATKGISTWTVDTDKGTCTLVVRDRSDLRFLSAHSVLMTDVNGMRYLVADTRKLDPSSAALLEEHT